MSKNNGFTASVRDAPNQFAGARFEAIHAKYLLDEIIKTVFNMFSNPIRRRYRKVLLVSFVCTLGGCGGEMIGAASDAAPGTPGAAAAVKSYTLEAPANKRITQAQTPPPDQPEIILISASEQGGWPPERMLDSHITDTSRWAAQSDDNGDAWVQIELSAAIQISEIRMAFYRGNQRRMLFDVLTSTDGQNWQQVYSGKSSGLTKGMENFKLKSTRASSIRIVGHGNSENNWNSIAEISIPGTDKSAYTTSEPPSSTPGATEQDNAEAVVDPDFVVRNQKELQAALDSSLGGELILLKNGHYGDLKIDRAFSDYVVLQAEHHLGAVFGDIEIDGPYGYLHLNRIKAKGARAVNGAHKFKYTRSKFTSTVYLKVASHFAIENNEIDAKGSDHALILNDVSNFNVTNNYIAHAQEDLLRLTGDSANGLIQDNALYDAMPRNTPSSDDRCAYNHSDGIQMFGADDKNPTNITIRGNHIYDNPHNNEVRPKHCVDGKEGVHLTMQGVFISDPKSKGYHNVLIEENLLYLGTPNSIYINGGTNNIVVRNNTLLPWPGTSGGAIRIVEKSRKSNKGVFVSRNVVSEIRDETTKLSEGMRLLKNFVYDTTDKNSPHYVNALFKGAEKGSDWQDFVPAEGGKEVLDDEYGAVTRIEGLIQTKSAPQPLE